MCNVDVGVARVVEVAVVEVVVVIVAVDVMVEDVWVRMWMCRGSGAVHGVLCTAHPPPPASLGR